MWYLGGYRIYVEKDSGWQTTPRLGEINVLDSQQTLLHDAGRPSYIRSLTFVVFSGYHESIIPLANNTVHSDGLLLLSDQHPAAPGEGYVYVKTMKADRLYDRSRLTAVYRVTVELIQKGSDGS